MDPVLLEIYRHRFEGIAEEMGVTLQRTSFSPNIKERLDFSCALFDSCGGLIAQAAHIPVHLGAMPASVEEALRVFDEWRPGDVVLLNDPYAGGTHLPDISMISAVFDKWGSKVLFFVASRAHHADVGGMTPGSLPLSREVYQEGIIIPPIKLYSEGILNEAVFDLILRNVRTPGERKGDFAAQRAAHTVGERRLHQMMEKYSANEVIAYATHLQEYSERVIRKHIATWPDGVFRANDYLEFDGNANVVQKEILVAVHIRGDEVEFNFSGTAPSMNNSLNAVLSITRSACYYVIISLLDEDVPVNKGCFGPVTVTAPEGCLLNVIPPGAVAGGNVETSQRVVDVALKALSRALPEKVPAASQGTMNNLTIGGVDRHGRSYAYYETIGGGMGASPQSNGLDGVHVHMSNTLNTPVEALEMAFPFRIINYGLRKDPGGAGKYSGGRGVVREYEFLYEALVTVLSERRVIAPWGLQGGEDGACGENILVNADDEEITLPSKFSRIFSPGERLRLKTPGGGGFGL